MPLRLERRQRDDFLRGREDNAAPLVLWPECLAEDVWWLPWTGILRFVQMLYYWWNCRSAVFHSEVICHSLICNVCPFLTGWNLGSQPVDFLSSLFSARLQGECSKTGGELLSSCVTRDCINIVPSQGLRRGNEVPEFHLLLAKKFVVPCHFLWARWDEIPFPVTLHTPLPR